MGIQSLLERLREIEKKKHVRSYSGSKVAVDAYCWLHKAVYTCKKDLAQGQGLDKLISFCIKRINLLREFNVTPIMVFDGGKLQMKKSVEEGRKKNREKCREQAEELLRKGDEENAMKKYGESIDITPQMAHTLIKVLQALEVEYYVAPYEADAQLAYLWFKKYVDVVFTEDSDLLAFGVKQVFFKMDSDGYGVEIDLNEMRQIKKPDFSEFTQDMLLTTCILSGCDYLESIKGIGFMKAQKLVETVGEVDTFQEVLKILKEEGKVSVPDTYEEDYQRAFLTFKFQRVYCPTRRKLVMLHDISECEEGSQLLKWKDTKFLGKEFDDEQIQLIATGQVDPISLKPFIDNDEENKIVEKILKKKNNSYANKKNSQPNQNQELPPILKNNPHPDYIELWNISPQYFWKQYWNDKRNGTMKFARRYGPKKMQQMQQQQQANAAEGGTKKKSRNKSKSQDNQGYTQKQLNINPFQQKVNEIANAIINECQEEKRDQRFSPLDEEEKQFLSEFGQKEISPTSIYKVKPLFENGAPVITAKPHFIPTSQPQENGSSSHASIEKEKTSSKPKKRKSSKKEDKKGKKRKDKQKRKQKDKKKKSSKIVAGVDDSKLTSTIINQTQSQCDTENDDEAKSSTELIQSKLVYIPEKASSKKPSVQKILLSGNIEAVEQKIKINENEFDLMYNEVMEKPEINAQNEKEIQNPIDEDNNGQNNDQDKSIEEKSKELQSSPCEKKNITGLHKGKAKKGDKKQHKKAGKNKKK